MDIIEKIALSKFHKTPVIIFLVGFSKAFDSINQDYIFELLSFTFKIDIKEEGFKPEDGGDLKIPVNQCFSDDMMVVIKET